ncbi:MAG TPA: LCP family protein [Desulfosporosinus sp.]|nr:LCP family protein [Desulfosporosinus sp.]
MRRRLKVALLAVPLLGIMTTGFMWYNGFLGGDKKLSVTEVLDVLDSSNDLDNRVSFLLIGADQRPDQEKFNTDSLILASVDQTTKQTSLLSIPRDTRIPLSGHGYRKINEVAALTDLPTLQKNVEKLTGEDLAGYVQTNFAGFKKIIDTLGGITVDVEKNMYYETGDVEDGIIDLKKGVQRLNGTQALQYARFRHDALGDISRTARQQVVLKAVAKEMFKLSTLPKLPFLVPQLTKAVNTNLSGKDILALAKVAAGFDSANVVSQTLPGAFLDIDGVSYWKVDPVDAKEVVQNLFLGITTDKVIDHEIVDLLKPITVTPKPLPKVPSTTQDPPVVKELPKIPNVVKELPKVPGNAQDPNGEESTGFRKP